MRVGVWGGFAIFVGVLGGAWAEALSWAGDGEGGGGEGGLDGGVRGGGVELVEGGV